MYSTINNDHWFSWNLYPKLKVWENFNLFPVIWLIITIMLIKLGLQQITYIEEIDNKLECIVNFK